MIVANTVQMTAIVRELTKASNRPALFQAFS